MRHGRDVDSTALAGDGARHRRRQQAVRQRRTNSAATRPSTPAPAARATAAAAPSCGCLRRRDRRRRGTASARRRRRSANISALPTIATTSEQASAQSPAAERRVDLFLGEEAEERRQAAHRERRPASAAAKVTGMARAQAAEPVTSRVPVSWSMSAGDHEQRALEQRMRDQIEHRRLDRAVRAEAGQHAPAGRARPRWCRRASA